VAGLKEALRVGTDRVVDNLGQVDGFNADPEVHIPLPKVLSQAQSSLRLIGASALVDDLELRINRAAEQATPVAKDIFWQAITSLTFEDVNAIYRGPDDAATQYLDRTTRGSLTDAMRPIVDDALADAGAVAAYDSIIERAQVAPFLPDLKTDLTNHVLDRAMDGMFAYLAEEEAAIRQDPVKRTTALLKRVFGAPT
jgi:membrane peptidoglycan carboxypeptidase